MGRRGERMESPAQRHKGISLGCFKIHNIREVDHCYHNSLSFIFIFVRLILNLLLFFSFIHHYFLNDVFDPVPSWCYPFPEPILSLHIETESCFLGCTPKVDC
jgi:hypothetical protein